MSPAALNAPTIAIWAAFAGLFAWRMHARVRRLIGRQRVSARRPWITVAVFPLVFVLLLLSSRAEPLLLVALLCGAAAGVALGWYGLRLTRFENTPEGLFYTPNVHLGIALSVILVLRLGYRMAQVSLSGGNPLTPPVGANGAPTLTPLTLLILGPLAGYYFTYAVGLLRWLGRSKQLQTLRYGPAASQVADLYLPAAPRPPVICLLHGGFWRLPYERAEIAPLARDLVARDYAVLNIEYRRVGELGGGWPGTLQDVAAAIDHLASLADGGTLLDLDRVVVAGHSAGGLLALWSGCRTHSNIECRGPARVLPLAVAGLAAGVDLLGRRPSSGERTPVTDFLGGTCEQYPERYAAASPRQLLPLGVRQLIIHGTADDALPVEKTREYVQDAQHAGDEIEYVEIAGGGHLDCLDPHGRTHAALCDWLARLLVRSDPFGNSAAGSQ